MERVLTKLGLERYTEAFEAQKITPDIVCKMSLYDMRLVGVTERSEIMKLRTKCISYGSSIPAYEAGGSAGPPMFQIPKSNLETLIDIGFTIKEISMLLSVSESTVYRRMRIFGIRKAEFTDISDEDLTIIIKKTQQEFPKCGERMLLEILRQKNVRVSPRT